VTWHAAIACAGAALALLAVASPASAGTPKTLYVDGWNGTATTGCTGTGSAACQTIQQGIDAARELSSSDVTLLVAPLPSFIPGGSYQEALTINVPATDTLTIKPGLSSDPAPAIRGFGQNTVVNVTGGTVRIEGFTIAGGRGSSTGGGVNVDGSSNVTLVGDTITGNTSITGGAGVYARGGSLSMINDTITNNTLNGGVGAGLAILVGSVTATNVTFADNTGGDATISAGPSAPRLTLKNSIIVGAPKSCNVSTPSGGLGGTTDGGRNVESDDTCQLGATSLRSNSSIQLDASLAANGSTGPQTLAIPAASSAHGEVPAAACTVTTDERGLARPGTFGQTTCDAGAFELQVAAPPPPPPATLTVGVAGDGLGSVAGAAGAIDCPNDCSTTVASGSTVVLAATPDPGYVFAGWSGACTGTSTCVVSMNGDQAVTATFSQAPRVTVSIAGTGSGTVTGAGGLINCSGGSTGCDPRVLPGQVTLTATPDPGSSFDGWSGAGCSGTSTCTFTHSTNETVTATFSSTTVTQSGSTATANWSSVTLPAQVSCSNASTNPCTATSTATTGTAGTTSAMSASAAASTSQSTVRAASVSGVTIGKGSLKLKKGKSGTLKLTLNAKGRLLLLLNRQLSTTVTVTITRRGFATVTKTLHITIKKKGGLL
jgi:uncharacterized repeat protein (TIGR02543 family)